MRRALWCLALLALSPCVARAQGVALVDARGPEGEVERWIARIAETLEARGASAVTNPYAWATEASSRLGSARATRVARWTEVERLLVAARRDAAELREGDAISKLARAERIAETLADVPGCAGWLAEVDVTLGLVAAQAGLDGLAETSLARAATLDRARVVHAAEAAPELVTRAHAMAARIATGPTGSFEVSSDAREAHVFLDDEDLGALPREVRTTVGRHVLRVEAAGRVPYGQLVDVLPGPRAPLHVSLARDVLAELVFELHRASADDDFARIPSVLSRLADEGVEAPEAWLTIAASTGRAVVVRCDPRGCDTARRLDPQTWGGELAATEQRAQPVDAADLAWLAEGPIEPPPPPPGTPLWQEWWFIAGASLLGAAAVALGTYGAVYATTNPPGEFSLTVTPYMQ